MAPLLLLFTPDRHDRGALPKVRGIAGSMDISLDTAILGPCTPRCPARRCRGFAGASGRRACLCERVVERGSAYGHGAPDDNCPNASTSAHYSMPVAMGDYSLLSSMMAAARLRRKRFYLMVSPTLAWGT